MAAKELEASGSLRWAFVRVLGRRCGESPLWGVDVSSQAHPAVRFQGLLARRRQTAGLESLGRWMSALSLADSGVGGVTGGV